MYSKRKNFFISFFIFCVYILFHCKCSHQVEGRYIFIDGGAHYGETINAFKKTGIFSEHKWKIYSFECNPLLVERLHRIFSTSSDVEIMNKAIWIHSKGLNFYFGKSSLGGNVVKNKYTAKRLGSIHVESIDFGDWLKANFVDKDTIWVKFDIEGAEYKILDKMLRDGSIKLVDKFYIEFHSSIMRDKTEKNDKEILNKIEKIGIPVQIKLPGSKEGDYFSLVHDN